MGGMGVHNVNLLFLMALTLKHGKGALLFARLKFWNIYTFTLNMLSSHVDAHSCYIETGLQTVSTLNSQLEGWKIGTWAHKVKYDSAPNLHSLEGLYFTLAFGS